MDHKEIIEIIKTKDNWKSSDLIKEIKKQANKQVNIKFCHIGGYELLRDGTKTEIAKDLVDVQGILIDHEIDFDETITDPIELANSIEDKWNDYYDDGGGSGWIE